MGNILSVIRSFIRKLVFPLDLFKGKGSFFSFFFFSSFVLVFLHKNILHSKSSGRQHHFYSSSHWGKIIHLIDVRFTANFNGMHLLHNWKIRATYSHAFICPCVCVCVLLNLGKKQCFYLKSNGLLFQSIKKGKLHPFCIFADNKFCVSVYPPL